MKLCLCTVEENLFDFTFALQEMHYKFLLHNGMHTWAPSYNQTLPSIYQMVNGLISFFYVDNICHTHIHTHIFVRCTLSISALCYFLLAPKNLTGSIFAVKIVGAEFLLTGKIRSAQFNR